MLIEEAILYAMEGNALLFLGAGFTHGAQNMANEEFPLGNNLCQRLIKDGKIDVVGESENDICDLGYISERYLEKNTKRDLLKFLNDQFKCKSYTDDQKEIGKIPWKRIYTTNYDNVFERLSMDLGIDRESIMPEKKSSEVLNFNKAIVHINGYIYTFENICKEDNSISMGDEAVKIFLNAEGTMDDVSMELKAFLDYVAGQKPEDSYVEKLEEAVQEAKKNREWRHEYMTLLMRDQENVEKGEELMLALIQKLVADKRFNEIERMKDDKDYRLILYREYHII